MRYSACIDQIAEIEMAQHLGVEELIVQHPDWAREGKGDLSHFNEILSEARQAKLNIVICTDRLIVENEWSQAVNDLSGFDSPLRVRDVGLARKLASLGKELHLALDAGNANREAIIGWEHAFKSNCKRLVLNHEIPRENLYPVLQELKIESELLGMGPIPMYTSPRKLLSFQGIGQKQVKMSSDEIGTGHFRLEEFNHSSLMYYNKELCILDHAEDLEKSGLSFLRLDLRGLDQYKFQCLKSFFGNGDFKKLRSEWPVPILHAYFSANRSDSVFKHLPKNRKEENQTCLAEVLDQDGAWVLVRCFSQLQKGSNLTFTLNHKKEIFSEVEVFDMHKNPVSSLSSGSLGLIKKSGKIQTGVHLYRHENCPS